MENKSNSKTKDSAEKEKEVSIEELKDVKYPVEQVGNEAPDAEDVKDAVKELNPDLDSLGFRG